MVSYSKDNTYYIRYEVKSNINEDNLLGENKDLEMLLMKLTIWETRLLMGKAQNLQLRNKLQPLHENLK